MSHTPDAKSLLGFLEQSLPHAESPVSEEYPTIPSLVAAEIEFARAYGLAVGLVEAGYIEVPFSYSVKEALEAAEKKARQLEKES